MHNDTQAPFAPINVTEVAHAVERSHRRGYDSGFIAGEEFGKKDRHQRIDRAIFIAGVIGMSLGSIVTIAILMVNAGSVAS